MRRAPSFPRSPRVRPYWRSRTQELVDMANSGLQVSSTGLVVSDQGLVVTDVSTGDACCCAGTGAACGGCSGSTPATWALTFNSVALSTSCFHVTGDPGSAKITTGTTFSGTFTLTQNGTFPYCPRLNTISTVVPLGVLPCGSSIVTMSRIIFGLGSLGPHAHV
jgi:hypothetical protein